MTAAEVLQVQAKVEGKAEGKAELLLRLLFRKFGTVPGAVRERIREASAGEVDAWADRLLVAATVKEVMAGVEVCK